MAKVMTTKQIAALYGCTRQAILERAHLLGLRPINLGPGHPYLWTVEQVEALRPTKRRVDGVEQPIPPKPRRENPIPPQPTRKATPKDPLKLRHYYHKLDGE